VHEFLAAASRLCQLYVYTMGDKNYAREMAALLDPSGRLFGGRIIANSDSTNAHTKDLDIVLGAEPAVLVVDDTDRVWPHNLVNLKP
jgi:RNA polymerase II C-terminal domain phosphatase-like 3/4